MKASGPQSIDGSVDLINFQSLRCDSTLTTTRLLATTRYMEAFIARVSVSIQTPLETAKNVKPY